MEGKDTNEERNYNSCSNNGNRGAIEQHQVFYLVSLGRLHAAPCSDKKSWPPGTMPEQEERTAPPSPSAYQIASIRAHSSGCLPVLS